MFPSSHRDRTARERRRLKAAKLFAQGHTQAAVARILNVSREATRKWHQTWEHQGESGLKSAGKPGPKPQLTPEKLAVIEAELFKGPTAFGFATQIWTLARIAAVMQRTFQVAYHPSYVWKLLASINWTCQKPETRAAERNEAAITRWRKVTWPRIKKKQSAWGQN